MNNINKIIDHVELSIKNAKSNISKLTAEILTIQGYSGIKTRHLYNNICNIPNAKYLEIGTYLGSTFISAMYKNNIQGIAVDNWSEFNGPKNQCYNNINKYIENKQSIKLIEKDFSVLNKEDINFDINIYLYDGNHSYESHKQSITHMYKFLAPLSIILVDDFRDDHTWRQVIEGTLDGIKESNLNILYEKRLVSKHEEGGRDGFWNGCGIFVCQK
jgi:hypothetical protein